MVTVNVRLHKKMKIKFESRRNMDIYQIIPVVTFQ